jgi:serine/threonine-protein kinase RsbW
MHPNYKELLFVGPAVDLARDNEAVHLEVHSPAELGPFFDLIEDVLWLMNYPRKDVFAVLLSVHEAVTNAYRHGNRRDRNKCIQIHYRVTAEEAVFEVADEGKGFDPSHVADPLAEAHLDRPGGRGLFLMRSYMTWISFNREGNHVTLARQRSQS